MKASGTLKLCVPFFEGKGDKEPKVCDWKSWFNIRRKGKLSADLMNEFLKKNTFENCKVGRKDPSGTSFLQSCPGRHVFPCTRRLSPCIDSSLKKIHQYDVHVATRSIA